VRLFAAVVPPVDVLDAIEEFFEPRREADPTLRWTSPDQWHLTLAFAADAPERALDDLEERLTRAAARRTPFALSLTGGGAFPSVGRARVLYLGVRPGDDTAATELDRLATGVRAAFSKAGCPVDGARFRAHLTLARLGHPRDVTRWVRLLDAFATRTFLVEESALIESHLGEGPRGKPRYVVRQRFPLAGHRSVKGEVG
jgi:2'-5' RNA ligase